LAELRTLVSDTEGMEAELEESLRAERERLRHLTELLEAAATAVSALEPEEGEGAAGLAGRAESAIAPVEGLAPELERAGDDLRDAELRLRETASALRRFAASLESDPERVEQIESDLDRISGAKRRFGCRTYEELLGRATEARAELAALEEGGDPLAASNAALSAAEARVRSLTAELCNARREAADPFAVAIAAELRGIGLGEGEFRIELRERDAGPAGQDEVTFLIRPNQGLPFAPVAETASGGELSRIALAIAAVGGGGTLVFDEIDAGIGGQTAHAVAETLARLAQHAQVVTITHLPQIASRADRHFSVEKVPGDPTVTRIRELDGAERREELERMLGGREFLAALQE
jgi:DNA repair protein RecN (Recombination protein N)